MVEYHHEHEEQPKNEDADESDGLKNRKDKMARAPDETIMSDARDEGDEEEEMHDALSNLLKFLF